MLKRLALVACSMLLAGNLLAAEKPHVLLTTSLGEIEIELESEKAPISVENFLGYVESGFYDNTVFHRVIPGFMIQGGGFSEGLNQKATRAPIKNEADNGLHNVRGTVAMARTQQVDSATSQFFINHRDNDFSTTVRATSATRCSARSCAAWMWLTRSPKYRPATAA